MTVTNVLDDVFEITKIDKTSKRHKIAMYDTANGGHLKIIEDRNEYVQPLWFVRLDHDA